MAVSGMSMREIWLEIPPDIQNVVYKLLDDVDLALKPLTLTEDHRKVIGALLKVAVTHPPEE